MRDWKRAFDIALSGAVLVASAPMLAMAAAAIKLDSAGPVLFRQVRVGRHRRPFEIFKLRTMTGTGSKITRARDPRVTRVGRWLRKAKLDEMPQLWNVLRGEMSLVGPRPEVPGFVTAYRPEWEELFSVRPGMTDLASMTFRDEESLLAGASDHERAYRDVIMPLKLALALEGVRRSSLLYDAAIIARTTWALLAGPNPAQRAVLAEARRRTAQLEREVS